VIIIIIIIIGLIRYVTCNFSSFNSLVVLNTALIMSDLEYAFVAWNNLTLTDSSKVENIQRKFASLCYRFFQTHILRNIYVF
jgi:hypothetical protein